MWEAKSERDSRIAELEDEVNELHHVLNECEQAAEVASRENQDSKQLLEETIRQLTYSLEKVIHAGLQRSKPVYVYIIKPVYIYMQGKLL